MKPTRLKTHKVIKIIDDRNLVINAGKLDDVNYGDCFEIYEESPAIFDPDTRENLGCLVYVKATITVTQLYPKMSVCTNTVRESSRMSHAMSIFTSFEPAALNVAPGDISGGINQKIHVGDCIRKISPPDPPHQDQVSDLYQDCSSEE